MYKPVLRRRSEARLEVAQTSEGQLFLEKGPRIKIGLPGCVDGIAFPEILTWRQPVSSDRECGVG